MPTLIGVNLKLRVMGYILLDQNRKTTGNMVLPKAGLTKYYVPNKQMANSISFLTSRISKPYLQHYLNRYQ
jgi:hypothetical protein